MLPDPVPPTPRSPSRPAATARQGGAWEALVREELIRARRRSRRSKVRTTPAPDLTADQPTTTTPTPPAAA